MSCSYVSNEIVYDIQDINPEETVSLELVIKESKEGKGPKLWENECQEAEECYSKSTKDDMASLKILKCEIVSARTVELQKQKKYVAYTVMVRVMGDIEDDHPALLERRYNDFLSLYNLLKKEYAVHLSSFQFPKKAIIGNFSPEVITERCVGFEAFLDLIGTFTQIRCCKAVATFFQGRELVDALKLIQEKQYSQAIPLVENCFWIMNKLQTDRTPAVLRNLCLWVCVAGECGDSQGVDLAGSAVRRFQGVSDSELLKYYVPLLGTTIELCHRHGKDGIPIIEHLESLLKRGIGRTSNQPLLQILIDDLISEGYS